MQLDRADYQMALAKAHTDPESFRLVETLIDKHFDQIEHLKRTPLYDVLQYEQRLFEPMKILTYENEKLKKEINKLRRELGRGNKYKEN